MVRTLSATRGLIPRPLLAVAVWSAALLVIGAAGYLGVQVLLAISFVLVPCIAAVLVTALMQPVNRWMQRTGISRGLASGLSLLACIAAVSRVRSAGDRLPASRPRDRSLRRRRGRRVSK